MILSTSPCMKMDIEDISLIGNEPSMTLVSNSQPWLPPPPPLPVHFSSPWFLNLRNLGAVSLETRKVWTSSALNAPANVVTYPNLQDSTQYTHYMIPGILDSIYDIDALGDYGAKFNFMNEDYAQRCGYAIDRKQVSMILIGNGKKVTTTGVAQLFFSFQGETASYSLLFHVLPNCIQDVILGKPFLKATKTFKVALNFARRVVKRLVSSLSRHHLLYLGESAPRFTGLVNGRPKEALADSGAKVLVMDEAYARSAGLAIVENEETRIELRFADGSTAVTSGMTYGVDWEFGLSGAGKNHALEFYILKNAPAHVILSEDFLLSKTSAFVEFDCYLLDEDDDGEVEEDGWVFAIDRKHKHPLQHQDPYSCNGAAQLFEDARETEAEDDIADLVGDAKLAAQAVENERRATRDGIEGAAPQTRSFNGSNVITPAPLSSPSVSSGGFQTPRSSKRRHKWRFWLKRKEDSKQATVGHIAHSG